ncbi:hypothetical protein Tco_0153540 [Tanacetum coccineum]
MEITVVTLVEEQMSSWKVEGTLEAFLILIILPEWKHHVTIVKQTKNLHEVNYDQLFDYLKHNQEEANEVRAERVTKSHDPLALVSNAYTIQKQTYTPQPSVGPQKYFAPEPLFTSQPLKSNMVTHVVKVPPSNLTIDVNNDDLFENMNKALAFLVKLFSLQYSSPTYNRLTTLSNTKNQAHVQVSQINVQGKNTGNVRYVGNNAGNAIRNDGK